MTNHKPTATRVTFTFQSWVEVLQCCAPRKAIFVRSGGAYRVMVTNHNGKRILHDARGKTVHSAWAALTKQAGSPLGIPTTTIDEVNALFSTP